MTIVLISAMVLMFVSCAMGLIEINNADADRSATWFLLFGAVFMLAVGFVVGAVWQGAA